MKSTGTNSVQGGGKRGGVDPNAEKLKLRTISRVWVKGHSRKGHYVSSHYKVVRTVHTFENGEEEVDDDDDE